MATYLDFVIDPDNDTGTDYTSIEACLAAEAKNLVSADQIMRLLCRSSSGSADTAAVSMATGQGWTTDSTRYVLVTNYDAANKAGAKWDSSKYRLEVTPSGGEAFDIEGSLHVVVDGIQLGINTSGSGKRILDPDSDVSMLHIKNCYLKANYTGTGGYGYAVDFKGSSGDYLVENCVVEGDGNAPSSGAWYGIVAAGSNVDITIVNTLVYGFYRCIRPDGTGAVVRCHNVVVKNYSGGGFQSGDGSYHASSDFNSSATSGNAPNDTASTTASPYYNGATAASDIWTDPANNDFTLKSGATIFAGAGEGPSAEALVPTTDIDGDARSGSTCDLGPDEFAVIGTEISGDINADSTLSGSLDVTPSVEARLTGSVDGSSTLSGALSVTSPIRIKSDNYNSRFNAVTNWSFAIGYGSGNNRKLTLFIAEESNAFTISSITYNGVAGTQFANIHNTTGAGNESFGFYWDDKDLPASPGTYTFVFNGSGFNGFGVFAENIINAKQGFPEIFDTDDYDVNAGHTISFELDEVPEHSCVYGHACNGSDGSYNAPTWGNAVELADGIPNSAVMAVQRDIDSAGGSVSIALQSSYYPSNTLRATGIAVAWPVVPIIELGETGVNGSSSLSGSLDVISAAGETHELTGQVDAVSSLSATLNNVKNVAGQISAETSLSGLANAIFNPAGVISGETTLSGLLDNLRNIVGSINAESSLSGLANAIFSPDGVISGDSSLSGLLDNLRNLQGVISAESSLSGDADATFSLEGVVSGLSTLSATILELHEIIGSLNADSSLSGDIDVVFNLSGIISATTSFFASILEMQELAGSINADSSLSGDIDALFSLDGSIDAETSLSGEVSTISIQSLTGQIDVLSDLIASLESIWNLAGSVDADSDLSAAITRLRNLDGTLSGSSSLSGQLTTTGLDIIEGAVNALSTISGAIEAIFNCVGSVNAQSSMSGSIEDITYQELGGSVDADSSMSGSLDYVETTMEIIVDTAGGGDYTSLDNAILAHVQDLVTRKKHLVFTCRGNIDSQSITFINAWTTNSTYFITIQADSNNRATNKWDNTKYYLKPDNAFATILLTNTNAIKVVFDGLQIQSLGTTNSAIYSDTLAANSNIEFKNCFIYQTYKAGSTNYSVFLNPGADALYKFSNCIFYTASDNASSYVIAIVGGITYIYNCIVISDGASGIYDISGTSMCRVKNTICRAGLTSFSAVGGFHADSDYNSSSVSGSAPVNAPRDNTQSPWYNGGVSDANFFIDSATLDFGLKYPSIVQDVGADLSSDSEYPISSDDINGYARDNDWDLGAYEIEYGLIGGSINAQSSLSASAYLANRMLSGIMSGDTTLSATLAIQEVTPAEILRRSSLITISLEKASPITISLNKDSPI